MEKLSISFFNSYGIDGSVNVEDRFIDGRHMLIIIKGKIRFGIGSIYDIQEIKLPSKIYRKFPREMMVSMDGEKWEKKIVVARSKTNFPYISFIKEPLEENVVFPYFLGWKYAKEIE